MARIPDSEIDRIKTETDLIALIQSRGTTLKKQGSNWTGLCPFHDDKETPNLIVTPGKGLFRCMAGHCGKTGNAIQFVQFFDGVSFRHAFDLLATGGKAAFEQTNGKVKVSTVPKLPCPLESQADDPLLMRQVINYYHKALDGPSGAAALSYFEKRGLYDPGLLREFKIGACDRSLGVRLPLNNRKEGAELRDKLKALGVYRPNGREHLIGCLTVPIFHPDGTPAQIYGRRIDPRAPKDKRHLLPRPATRRDLQRGGPQKSRNHPLRKRPRCPDILPSRHGSGDLHLRHRELHRRIQMPIQIQMPGI